MNRNKCKAVEDAIKSVLQGSDHPALQGLNINTAGGSYSANDCKLKIIVSEQSDENVLAVQTADDARYGLLKPGTEVVVYIRGGSQQRGKIVAARRTRYSIEGIGGKYDGTTFTYPFSQTKLA